MLKYFYILLFLLLPLYINGQSNLYHDTIKISEVVIKSHSARFTDNGYKKTVIDSSELSAFRNKSIGRLLTNNSGIALKSYGMGGSATPSFRGTGAGNTQVAWNGINLNNPMLGQSDLSILSTDIADNLTVYYGGASMGINNGVSGALINIESVPDWKNETSARICSGIASFGNYAASAKIKVGNSVFQSVTKGFINTAENNFSYINNESGNVPIREIRKNSQFSVKGLMQELYLRKAENSFSTGIWYQSADRNLPSSLLNQQINSGEKQFDESLKLLMDYKRIFPGSKISITGGYLMNRLDYANRLAGIDSRNSTESYILRLSSEHKTGNNFILRTGLNEEFVAAKTNNYNSAKSKNNISANISGDLDFNRLGVTLLIREIIDRDQFLLPDFSAAVKYRLSLIKKYFVKASVSRNSKIPSMNDMFWFPGGNAGLKNEYAFIYEGAVTFDEDLSSRLNLSGDLTFFRNSINDMIVWHPGEFAYWEADNIQSVKSYGLELTARLEYVNDDFSCRFKAYYTYTDASIVKSYNSGIMSGGKQLIYVPVNQLKSSLNVKIGKIGVTWFSDFTGKRFTSVDNSDFLSGYFLNELSADIMLKMKESSVNAGFSVENIFNVSYQTIAYYPLPGRIFNLNLSYFFNK